MFSYPVGFCSVCNIMMMSVVFFSCAITGRVPALYANYYIATYCRLINVSFVAVAQICLGFASLRENVVGDGLVVVCLQ